MSKKRFYVQILIKVCIIIAVVAIDLLTKHYFQQYFKNGGDDVAIINGVLGITYVQNTGGAFGVLSSNTTLLVLFTVLFIVIFSFVDIGTKTFNGWYLTGFTLIMGGAIGNFIDRIFLGYVRDFIEFKFIDFPVFNFADIFLTVGVICYLIYLVFYEMIKPKSKKNAIDE